METTNWIHGQKKRIAERAGTSLPHLSDILHGRKTPSKEMAQKIEDASVEVLGEERKIPAESLVWPERFPHPLVGKKEN